MLKSINKYLKNNEFSINILENIIDINNFIDIIVLEPNKIVLSIPSRVLKIYGSDLTINKLLDNEITITGTIKAMEFADV